MLNINGDDHDGYTATRLGPAWPGTVTVGFASKNIVHTPTRVLQTTRRSSFLVVQFI
jgi:hypothetical protein